MPAEARELRIHNSMLAAAEKRLLVAIARRLPPWMTSDHLTALGAGAMLAGGVAYGLAALWPGALLLAILLLAVNWFGDSLDGTLARVRRLERPRYGYYVDHVLDAAGVLCLVAGMMAGGFLSLPAGAAFLIAYYLLMIEIALATHALGTFRMSYWKVGPTELRILIAAGTVQALRSPLISLGGHEILLFDVGAWVGAAVLVLTFVITAVSHTRTLFRLEPLRPNPLSISRLRAKRFGEASPERVALEHDTRRRATPNAQERPASERFAWPALPASFRLKAVDLPPEGG